MATTKLYLDCRAVKRGMEAPIKLSINKRSSSAYIGMGVKVFPTQWNARTGKIIDHPNKTKLNSYLSNRKMTIDNIILELTVKGELALLTATQVKNKVMDILYPMDIPANNFITRFESFITTRNSESTKEQYRNSLKHILEFDNNARKLTFEDINKDWLVGFDSFLSSKSLKKNTSGGYMRNIRAVFNDAIDNEITTNYPFRSKFKIKYEETVKRSLSVEQLCEVLAIKHSNGTQTAVDFFWLSFCLIGCNMADMYNLDEINTEGRIEYRRAKTNKIYSVKVEEEALHIINKYRGKDKLLFLADVYSYPRIASVRFNLALKRFGFNDLSMYWARHTWATIAAELEIPAETISAALGHSGYCATTSIYVKFNYKKVDEANRKVLDYVKQKLADYKSANHISLDEVPSDSNADERL